jgi:hypothetical protein
LTGYLFTTKEEYSAKVLGYDYIFYHKRKQKRNAAQKRTKENWRVKAFRILFNNLLQKKKR